jgi:ryanodine receptor 2
MPTPDEMNPVKVYTPSPIPVDEINLPDELAQLVERVAENAHDVWARQRLSDNWTLGPRDDEKKCHPCLIPYSELPDSEREYDRILVVQTLKTILKLGYIIRRP